MQLESEVKRLRALNFQNKDMMDELRKDALKLQVHIEDADTVMRLSGRVHRV